MCDRYGLMDEGTDKEPFYIYDFEQNEVLHNAWFETEAEAQDYLDNWLIEGV